MDRRLRISKQGWLVGVLVVPLVAVSLGLAAQKKARVSAISPAAKSRFQPRGPLDTSAFGAVTNTLPPWSPNGSLAEIARSWKGAGYSEARRADLVLAGPDLDEGRKLPIRLSKASALLYEGEAEKAYGVLKEARSRTEADPNLAAASLYTVIYFQGIAALRLGETENCVDCRGASACILPFDPAAVHQFPRGSRLAIQHFTEYLKEFPDDLEVRWLLNLAHMTLGEYPDKVPQELLVRMDRYNRSEASLGRFRDIGHLVGLDRANNGGGAIMDDFNNDGLLDMVVSSFNPSEPLGYYRNMGDGQFREMSKEAGLTKELGGLNCVQADYNNDGYLDIYVIRGAWLKIPMPQSLLRNNGNGTFTNVTEKAGLDPLNSNGAQWADFDNDGYLDLFACSEHETNRLYHNQGDGTFKDVAGAAGLLNTQDTFCKGVTWLDYNDDSYPDLFVNYLDGRGRLFRNDHNGKFTDVSDSAGIDGPREGFSCWAFDYNNDGRQDIFATCYQRTLKDLVKGVLGQPHESESNRLFRNVDGTRFENVTKAAGLDVVFSTMGSNFGDFDNDGYPDMYLATGDPNLATLIPNRMLKNVGGERFVEVTGSSGTGHVQKGHGIACGDWDRDGNVDLFAQMGGAVPGDRYHNLLFQNPGHNNSWLTVKLTGKKSNRSAIGARIKATTAGKEPRTFYRWVSSGSSFGANPLQQTIGLGKAERLASLEIYWPTSRTTQVFRDVAVGQALEITEGATKPKVLAWKPLPVPKGGAPTMAAMR